ncbi:TIR domain-containing protein [Kribbella sp. NPDC050820]|uniref:TIR domain-containing protein n=1 Tax=Kribbella sp. NPDC050820 TaxID=3155408 RepID=UPI0034029C26
MARRTFFSFKYDDVSRAMVVRNSWITQDRSARGFIDAAEFEKLKRNGDAAIRRWIDEQMDGTSVTVVLVGAHTNQSRWVKYEIERSEYLGHGLLGIDISKIKDLNGLTTDCCGSMPAGYDFYRWNNDGGYANMAAWIEKAAATAGR